MPPYKLLLTLFDACLNGIFRVALNAISWAPGVELNYTIRRGRVFFVTFTDVFFIFVTFFNVF